MPSNPLLTSDDSGNPLSMAPWGVGDPTDPASLATAQVGTQPVDALGQWLAAQRAKSSQMGLWDDQTGLPTQAGWADAIRQAGTAVALGTGSGGDAPPGGLFLDRFDPRTGRKMADPDLTVPGNHAYFVRNPAGEHLGTVETEWDPNVGDLNIANVQSNEGANSFGPAAVKQLRDALFDQYPDARTLSGYRVTGANPNREIFQRVQSDQGRP